MPTQPASLTQDQRILRLSTPLGRDRLVAAALPADGGGAVERRRHCTEVAYSELVF